MCLEGLKLKIMGSNANFWFASLVMALEYESLVKELDYGPIDYDHEKATNR
jgi:hypothetical protein